MPEKKLKAVQQVRGWVRAKSLLKVLARFQVEIQQERSRTWRSPARSGEPPAAGAVRVYWEEIGRGGTSAPPTAGCR